MIDNWTPVENTLSANYIQRTFNDFQQWLRTSTPNSQFLYYEGFLAKDCQLASSTELTKFAKSVMKLAEKRVITLVQQKLGSKNYKYIAIKL